MKLTLNPYAFVIDMKGTLNIFLSDSMNPVKIVPNDEQKKILEAMYQGEFYEYIVLCENFGKELVDTLCQNGCLTEQKIDTQTIYSRTNAFFLTHNMKEARERLAKKKVLILGCGGIGTHMAWHMVSLGIGKLTLVDFDTVENSNFNRQILFDCNDMGKLKVNVLKEKLLNINRDIQIETVCTKISSEEELEEICTSDDYDLVIKSLDSPAEFPVWLEHVSKKHNLTYISGITMRENVLIGPTYIPGKSNCGWSDLMGVDYTDVKKVYGTAPSLGIMLYHIADELAVEAFKILTGYGKIKYIDKILCRNLLTEEEQFFSNNSSAKENVQVPYKENEGKMLMLDVLMIIILSVAGMSERWFYAAAFITALVLPLVLYKTSQDVVRCTFLNAVVFSVGALRTILRSVTANNITELLTVIFLLFGVQSALILFMCVFNYCIRRSGERLAEW